jgi:hypothetical protein
VGANQPIGSLLISDLAVTAGSLDLDLDLDIELATTAAFDNGEPAIEIELAGLEVVSIASPVPVLSGAWLAVLAGVLVVAFAALHRSVGIK